MTARLVVEFFVDGIPVPQGSKSAWVNTRGEKPRAVIHDDNAKVLKPWRENVTVVAREAYRGPQIEGPVQLVLTFQFVRPKSVRRELPSVKPDLSKLLRAVEDAITVAGVWKDDALVVKALIEKKYADRPGVWVQIGEFPTPNREKSSK